MCMWCRCTQLSYWVWMLLILRKFISLVFELVRITFPADPVIIFCLAFSL